MRYKVECSWSLMRTAQRRTLTSPNLLVTLLLIQVGIVWLSVLHIDIARICSVSHQPTLSGPSPQWHDLALDLVECHEVCIGPHLQPFQVPLYDICHLQCVNCTTQLGVISSLTFNPIVTSKISNRITLSFDLLILLITGFHLDKVKDVMQDSFKYFAQVQADYICCCNIVIGGYHVFQA